MDTSRMAREIQKMSLKPLTGLMLTPIKIYHHTKEAGQAKNKHLFLAQTIKHSCTRDPANTQTANKSY